MMNFKNFTAKTTLSVVFGLFSILGMISFAADPSFSISPASFTGKLHCEYSLAMIINPGGLSYNAFQSTIRFESGYVLVTPVSISPVFNGITFAGITSGFLYEAYGTMAPGTSSTSTVTGLTFKFKTIQNLTSTNLLLTTITGGTIVFDKNTTDDGAVLNSSINSLDMLTGVNDGSYTFVPLPCIPDVNPPTMGRNTPTNGQTNIPDNYDISLVLYDRAGAGLGGGPAPMTTNNNKQHYRYSGNNTSILSNYVPAIIGVDNQEGVNSGTISITVDCPTCVGGSWPYVFIPATPSLTITERTGNGSINELTRQNKIRGYVLNFPAPAPYEIEKLVTVDISVSDNPNEDNATHTGTPSFSFNAPQNPVIARTSPAGSSNIPTTFSPFIFTFTDDRAGIDTGSISITIPEYSSGSKFYTGYTYSGNELSITLINGSPGTGNSGSYQVSFAPLRAFPSNADIQITGSVNDLAGNIGTYNATFVTAISCADLGCADYFTVNIFTGFNAGTFSFTGTLIQITGTNINSPYPYLTGLNNDILVCGLPYSGTILTGNIGIFDTTGTQINGTLFTGDELYITGTDGLDFIYDNGTIIIN